jgi:hypothetical protein
VSEVVAWLRAELDRVEQLAQATTAYQPYDEWTPVGVDEDRDTARSCWEVALIARPAVRSPSARSLMEHIAVHDPATVLRRVAADRQILDEHQSQRHAKWRGPGSWDPCELPGCRCVDVPEGSPEADLIVGCGTCASGHPYDAVVEHYPCRTVRLLAEAYGWTEESS